MTTCPAPIHHETWRAELADLSPRERDVLCLITNCLTNQEISDRLYVSLNSVKTYIRGAYRKIGVTTRAQAVVWGVRHGLLEDEFPERHLTAVE
ncbi:hypothetical protein BH09ACT12_BH09ACT12_06980 [soil metagenome]